MEKIAVILTVYNRKEVTLQGLRSLNKAIENLGGGYFFDIYMTDDGCTDGTGEAVHNEFPQINIIRGDGTLYWSWGMRKAWQAAIDSNVNYDYYLWYNDDADLYDDALVTIFNSINNSGSNVIITGAFCDHEGKVSYGGKISEDHIVTPCGVLQEVVFMNGNLVLIPNTVFEKLGKIDKQFRHGLGDYDYGLRARKNGVKVFLTTKYVGMCDRHDVEIPTFYSCNHNIIERFAISYKIQNNPSYFFFFLKRHFGLYKALRFMLARHFYLLFPQFYKRNL